MAWSTLSAWWVTAVGGRPSPRASIMRRLSPALVFSPFSSPRCTSTRVMRREKWLRAWLTTFSTCAASFSRPSMLLSVLSRICITFFPREPAAAGLLQSRSVPGRRNASERRRELPGRDQQVKDAERPLVVGGVVDVRAHPGREVLVRLRLAHGDAAEGQRAIKGAVGVPADPGEPPGVHLRARPLEQRLGSRVPRPGVVRRQTPRDPARVVAVVGEARGRIEARPVPRHGIRPQEETVR